MKTVYLIAALLLFFNSLAQETTTIYLIRHAEIADDTGDPELSEAGNVRAKQWATYFKPMLIETFYATQFKRSINTIIPASVAGVEPVVGATYTMQMVRYDAEKLLLKDVAEKHKGEKILIAGHSNTIPKAINKLIGKEIYEEIPKNVYGNLYIITIIGDKITHELVKI